MKLYSNHFTFLFIGTIILLLSSCSNSSNSLNTIPKNVGLIANVNLSNLKNKSEAVKITELYSLNEFNKKLRRNNKYLFKIVDDILNTPSKTGIDFNKDLFMFYLNEVKDEHYFSIVFDLTDSETFEQFISQEVLSIHEDAEIQKGNNFEYTIIKNDLGIGWDTDKAILLIPEDSKSKEYMDFELDNLFNLKDENCITQNKSFSRFYEDRKDISFWLNSNLVLNNEKFNSFKNNMLFDLEDHSLFTYITFNDGEINISNKIEGNGELIQLLNKLSLWSKNENKITTQLIPKDSYAQGKISVNPEAIDNLLIDFFDYYDQFKKDFERGVNIPFTEALNSLDGNITFSLNDFEMREYEYKSFEKVYNERKYKRYNRFYGQYQYEGGYDLKEKTNKYESQTPLFGISVGLKNREIADEFLNNFPENMIEKHKQYYSIRLDKEYEIYSSINESFIYLSNDEDRIRNLALNNFKNSESAKANQDIVSKSDVYVSGELNFNNYPKVLKKEFRDMQNSEESKMFKTWNDFAKSIEIIKNRPNSLDIKFSTNNSNENSLVSLLEFLDQNYKILNQ